MKSLTLLRHAKSAWDDAVTRDIERPLNARGRKAARLIGEAMRVAGLRFDKILASPATRVVETLDDVAHGYGGKLDVGFDDDIYLASAESLLDRVRETDDTVGSLLVVGHNPGLERLALLLSGKSDRKLRSSLGEKYPTAALAQIELPVEHWQDVVEGRGQLVRFVRPRDLDPQLGPEE